MTPRRLAGLVLACGLTGILAGDGAATPGQTTVFREIAWPFLLDQWGRGQAFRCVGPHCGVRTALYVRSKVGFCDCFNHVDDDDDVDRLTDFGLIGGDRVVPLGSGQPIAVAGRPARLRAFDLDARQGRRQAVSVVVATECQALVGMLVLDRNAAPAIETAALEVLGNALGSRSVASSVGRPAATFAQIPGGDTRPASTNRTDATR
jgi:hypothetical protein